MSTTLPPEDNAPGQPLGIGLNDQLGVKPPAMPRPAGYAKIFTPLAFGRKLDWGFEREEAVYTKKQMQERDKKWAALLVAHTAARVDA